MQLAGGKLVRSIGRWSLAALMINTMIGASIFGLPALIAGYLGTRAPLGFVVAAAVVGAIAACFAEVASQFREAGGPYLYVREAFGPLAGIEIGWLTWLNRVAAASAVADLFITYLSGFVPAAKSPAPRALVLLALWGILAAVNYRGVTTGNRVSNFFTVAKLALLGFFIVTGLLALWLHPALRILPQNIVVTPAHWLDAIILMIYSYGGFEAALVVSGEMRNPRRDVPLALLVAMAVTTALYVSVQYLVIHTIASPGATSTPVVDAARHFLPASAVSLVAAGTLVSAYGYLSANMLHTPRVTFAMAERRDFPRVMAAVHPQFRTPYISILVFTAALLSFSIAGSFKWNAILSAVSRLFVYAFVAVALLRLRKKRPEADAFRLPFAWLFVSAVLLFTALLVTRMDRAQFVVIALTVALALLNWLWARKHQPQESTAVTLANQIGG